MKIALITEWLDPGRGGAETAVGQYVRHLADRGVEVVIVTRSRTALPGAEVVSIGGIGGSRSRNSLRFPQEAGLAAAKTGSDLIHAIPPVPNADIYQPRGGTVAETLAQNIALRHSRSGRWLKRVLQHLSPKQRRLLRIEQTLLNRKPAPMVVAISDYVSDQLRRHYGFDPLRIRKVFNAVDPDPDDESQKQADRRAVRERYGIPDGECVALLVAHNFKLKGVPCWLEAMRLLKEQGGAVVRSLIVGKGRSPRWEHRVRRMGLTDRVILAGAVEHVRACYHAADFLVHPSWYDPCSRVVLEAVSSGLPCIVTRFDGSAEVIRHERNGYVLSSPNDIEAMTRYAGDLAAMNPLQRKRMGADHGLAPGQIDMKRHADEMIRVYEEVLNERHKS